LIDCVADCSDQTPCCTPTFLTQERLLADSECSMRKNWNIVSFSEQTGKQEKSNFAIASTI